MVVGDALCVESVRVSLLRRRRSALLSKLHRRLRLAWAVALCEGLNGLLMFGMLRLNVWVSGLVTIHPCLVPTFPPRSKLSLPVTLPQPWRIWTGLPSERGPFTHHSV